MLESRTLELVRRSRDAAASMEDIQAAAEDFFQAVQEATHDDISEASEELARNLDISDPRRAAFLALVCGALAEAGVDPDRFAEPMLQRLSLVLEAATRVVEECEKEMPPFFDEQELEDDDSSDEESFEEDEEEDEEIEDRFEIFERIRSQLGVSWDADCAAWESLDQFWPPAIVALSVSPRLRDKFHYLIDNASRIAEYHEAGHWLGALLVVLEDEPIVVIEPSTGKGILARISGVVDNFQLHVLLMDVFPVSGMLKRRRVSRAVAEVVRGQGPQQIEESIKGAWNLYEWRAVQDGLELPDSSDYCVECWIWNEGTPEDIPVLGGRRVILLGPPSYDRQWEAQRIFERLPADVVVEKVLTKDEVQQWLQQMYNSK